jgi:hypothetical protein
MDRSRIAVWTLALSAPLACMCARNDTGEVRRTLEASMAPQADRVVTVSSLAAEPEGTGGTSASAKGGGPAGGHGGKNTRNGKDDHNSE